MLRSGRGALPFGNRGRGGEERILPGARPRRRFRIFLRRVRDVLGTSQLSKRRTAVNEMLRCGYLQYIKEVRNGSYCRFTLASPQRFAVRRARPLHYKHPRRQNSPERTGPCCRHCHRCAPPRVSNILDVEVMAFLCLLAALARQSSSDIGNLSTICLLDELVFDGGSFVIDKSVVCIRNLENVQQIELKT